MARANAALTGPTGEEAVWAQATLPTVKGPMVQLEWVGEADENRDWLDVFALALSEAGSGPAR